MIHAPANERTLVPSQDMDDGTMVGSRASEGTMIEHSTGTLVPHGRGGRNMGDDDDINENLGTMVINSDGEEDGDSTMKRMALFPQTEREWWLMLDVVFNQGIKRQKASRARANTVLSSWIILRRRMRRSPGRTGLPILPPSCHHLHRSPSPSRWHPRSRSASNLTCSVSLIKFQRVRAVSGGRSRERDWVILSH